MNRVASVHTRTGRVDWTKNAAAGAALALLATWLLTGCGGPAQATPTAIPASIVRPVQPTPAYPDRADVYALLTPGATAQFVAAPAGDGAEAAAEASGGARAAIALYIKNQTPSAVGIAPGGAAIYSARGGRSVASVPVGGVLTVTGKSADGAWYAVYNEDAAYGWTPAGQLRVYGGDDLVVVEEAPDPAPIATLLAQAAAPVVVLDELLAQFDVKATAIAQQPAAAPTAEPTSVPTSVPAVTPIPTSLLATATSAPGAPAGIVSSEGRLNLRSGPDTEAAIVRKLDPGEAVTILERNGDNSWLRVQLADGVTGWVAAEFVAAE